jgi:hypothetical protein
VGSPIQITGIRVYGSGDALICEVTVTGGVHGTLYLQGNPALAPDGRTLALRHFMFTMETSNLLMRLANRTMYDTIRDTILPYTRIDIANRAEVLRRRIERQMNRQLGPDIWIEGAVTTLVPNHIYPVKRGIELQLLIDGTLSISLD